jgi:REase_MTES_1575
MPWLVSTRATAAPGPCDRRSSATAPAPSREATSSASSSPAAVATASRRRSNAQIHGFEVDFLFAAQRLVVETDGWRYHRTRRAFERDRDRDAALLMSGYRTLRVTHHRLRSDPAGVAATLRALLGA